MLKIFVPLLVDESLFFANFMCFEVPALSSLGSAANGNQSASRRDEVNYDELGIMDIDNGDQEAELATLNECLKELLDEVQVAVIEHWIEEWLGAYVIKYRDRGMTRDTSFITCHGLIICMDLKVCVYEVVDRFPYFSPYVMLFFYIVCLLCFEIGI